jgi:predicted permease
MLTNNGFLGIPVASIIFSTTGVFYLVIGNIVMNFFIYSFSILNIIHSNPQSKSKSAKPKVRDILKELFNLPMVSSLLGLCIFLIQIPLPKDLFFLLDTLGAMMAPLAMMVIGIQLLNSNLKKLVINHKLILMSAFRLLIIPGTIFAILFVFYSFGLIDRLQVSIVTLNWAFPCAAMGVILAEQYNSDVLFASEGTFLSTFFSIFTLPFVGAFLAMWTNG